MFRFLIIIGIILYLLYKIGGFFFRAGAASQQYDNNRNRQQTRRPSGGNVDINAEPRKDKKKSNFKGGDYIDYEEVK